MAELMSIGVAGAMFSVSWNSRRFSDNDYLTYLGIVFLSVACLDLLHTLAYKGLGVFPGYGADLPTQLWVAARALESLSLLISPIFLFRRIRPWPTLAAYLAIVSALLILIFPLGVFPTCYREGGPFPGLTPFKIAAEYIICMALAAGMGLLWANRIHLPRYVFIMIILAMGATVLSELAFTRYASVYGDFNMVGHLLKFGAFLLFYKATVEASLKDPYHALFLDRSRQEEALRESEAKYRNLFMNMAEEVRFWQLLRNASGDIETWRLLDINPPALKAWGKTLDDTVGKSADEIFPGATAHFMPLVRRIMTEGAPHSYETYLPWMDRYLRVTSVPLGECFITTGADITGIKKANEELELRVQERTESLRRQAELLELAHSAIFVRDMESRITFWNARAEEVYGWTKTEALGNITHGFLKTRFPVPFEQHMATLLSTGRWEGELMHTRKDGHEITVLSRQALQTGPNQDPMAIMEINLDVTESRQIEAQLRQAQKLEALGTLAGGIAHDFNNVLAAIIGFTEMVQGHLPDGSREKHYSERVLQAAMRGRDLVKQMLTFSRRSEEEAKPVRLSAIVAESVKLLRGSIPATINIEVDVKSESGVILGDPVHIQQMIINLAVNAAYAMREKGGVLNIELADFSIARTDGKGMAPGLYMKLAVRDSGEGIPREVMDKIFDPFFTTKKVGEGTGLGLSVVLGIVKQFHGHISAESEPGVGSTFTIYWPKVAGGSQRERSVPAEVLPLGHERILFVDDEKALVEMGEELLAELGYEVHCSTSGGEALALFKLDPTRFDVGITDQTMPEMTGVQLASELLSIRPDIPIVLCTGFSHTASEESTRAAGIKGFAMKPLTKQEIATVVRKVLDG
jgi:PAS domain S-box-containing protein